MTEPQPVEHDTQSRYWVLKTLGLAFGLAILLVGIVTVALLALESPANRHPVANAASIAAPTPSDAAGQSPLAQPTIEAPTSIPEPTQTPEGGPTATPVADQTAFARSVAVMANQNQPSVAQTPGSETVLTTTDTITPVVTPQPTATRPPVVARLAAARTVAPPKSSTPVPSQPAASVAPAKPLEFSFYVKEYCASERSFQILQVMLTAHGGVPPYDYYNDATLVGKAVPGSVVVEVKAAYGNPVPLKLIAVDKTGQRHSETFFWKSTKRCSWKPIK